MSHRLALLAVLAIPLLLIGCSGEPSAPEAGPGTIMGSITLNDGFYGAGDTCTGDGGYSDIGPNMNVTVRNEKAEIIGTGNTKSNPITDASYECDLSFTVSNLPNASFYSIEAGKRGELTYSREEMETMGWNVSLSIGS